MKSLRVPVEIIVAEHDPARRLAIEPLLRLRPDFTELVIADANHLSCVIKPQFKAEIVSALTRHLGKGTPLPADPGSK